MPRTKLPNARETFVFKPRPAIPPEPDDEPLAPVAAATARLQAEAAAPHPLWWAIGTYRGTGFNTIWRPFHKPPSGAGEDEFLELDLTVETLDFREQAASIPNRGLKQHDLTMHGVAYTDQISAAASQGGGGLHLEPGLWLAVPHTTAPHEPPTVARLASIPHGTTVLLQGLARTVEGFPELPATNIVPFDIGKPAVRNSDPDFAAKLAAAKDQFHQMVLAHPNQFRQPSAPNPPGITQTMVDDPSVVLPGLDTPPAGSTFRDTVRIDVTTAHQPVLGGGTANTAFLHVNANASQAFATFQATVVHPPAGEPYRWLQYVQTVLLDFDELSWPHVTVGSMTSPCP